MRGSALAGVIDMVAWLCFALQNLCRDVDHDVMNLRWRSDHGWSADERAAMSRISD
jgi:hypothetical protein